MKLVLGMEVGRGKLVLGMEVGLSPGDFVLDGDPVPFPQKGVEPPPQFSAHFYCGQTVRCIKMPLGMEIGFSPMRLCVRWGPTSPPQKRAELLPNLRPMSIVAKQLDGSRCHVVRR